jgi:hypothetical protein
VEKLMAGLMDLIVDDTQPLVSLAIHCCLSSALFVDKLLPDGLEVKSLQEFVDKMMVVIHASCQLHTKVESMISTSKPMPVTTARALVHKDALDLQLFDLNRSTCEDQVKFREKIVSDSVKLLKALMASVSKADKDLSTTVGKRENAATMAKDSSVTEQRKKEARSTKDMNSRLKKMEDAVNKFKVPPIFAWKSDSVRPITTFANVVEKDKCEKEKWESSHGVPIVITDVGEALQKVMEDEQVKKILAVFRSQFKTSPGARAAGRTQCSLKVPGAVLRIHEELLRMMPATVWVNPDITNGKWQTLGVTAAMGEEISTALPTSLSSASWGTVHAHVHGGIRILLHRSWIVDELACSISSIITPRISRQSLLVDVVF